MKKVKGYIERKNHALEYSDYTMNHIQGCADGCKYPCYTFMMKKRFGQIKSTWNGWSPIGCQIHLNCWTRKSLG